MLFYCSIKLILEAGWKLGQLTTSLTILSVFSLCVRRNAIFYRSIYTVSKTNCAKMFLSELLQISINFDNFWQKDGKEPERG